MDFGDILNEWDKIKRERKEIPTDQTPKRLPNPPGKAGAKAPNPPPAAPGSRAAENVAKKKDANEILEAWLRRYGVSDKDAAAADKDAESPSSRETRRLYELQVQDVLDLHGMTADEARTAINAFIDQAARRGLEKVLVIHGKGIHSEGMPVLKRAARRALESHPLAGRIGEAARSEGGSGALWVLIKSRK
jgi:DNA-nicking Smr family endonuclease